MSRRRYEPGQVLGKFTLIRPLPRPAGKSLAWVVRCECGREVNHSNISALAAGCRGASGRACRACYERELRAAADAKPLRCKRCGTEDPARFRFKGTRRPGQCVACEQRGCRERRAERERRARGAA